MPDHKRLHNSTFKSAAMSQQAQEAILHEAERAEDYLKGDFISPLILTSYLLL